MQSLTAALPAAAVASLVGFGLGTTTSVIPAFLTASLTSSLGGSSLMGGAKSVSEAGSALLGSLASNALGSTLGSLSPSLENSIGWYSFGSFLAGSTQPSMGSSYTSFASITPSYTLSLPLVTPSADLILPLGSMWSLIPLYNAASIEYASGMGSVQASAAPTVESLGSTPSFIPAVASYEGIMQSSNLGSNASLAPINGASMLGSAASSPSFNLAGAAAGLANSVASLSSAALGSLNPMSF